MFLWRSGNAGVAMALSPLSHPRMTWRHERLHSLRTGTNRVETMQNKWSSTSHRYQRMIPTGQLFWNRRSQDDAPSATSCCIDAQKSFLSGVGAGKRRFAIADRHDLTIAL